MNVESNLCSNGAMKKIIVKIESHNSEENPFNMENYYRSNIRFDQCLYMKY